MEVKELQAMIEVRNERKKVLEWAEHNYAALMDAIEKYGDKVVLQYISFSTPEENISFSVAKLAPIPVKTMAKHISASIKQSKRTLKNWEDELKGIVEFTD